jgi:hypothetical protein
MQFSVYGMEYADTHWIYELRLLISEVCVFEIYEFSWQPTNLIYMGKWILWLYGNMTFTARLNQIVPIHQIY